MTIETTQYRETHQKLCCSRGKPRLRLGTWNVRTLNDQPGKEEGKVALLVRELQKHKVDICGLSEVKREGQGATLVEQGHMLIHSGPVKGRAHGVGFCLSPAARAALVQYTCISNVTSEWPSDPGGTPAEIRTHGSSQSGPRSP